MRIWQESQNQTQQCLLSHPILSSVIYVPVASIDASTLFSSQSGSLCEALFYYCSGVGAGTTEHIAHDAARKAATQERDVTVEGREGKAYGHPTGAARL